LLEEIELFCQGKDWRTCSVYHSYGKRFERFLEKENLTLKELKPIDIKKFIYSAGTNKKGEFVLSSAQAYKRFIAAFCRFLGRNDLVDYIRISLKEIKAKGKFKVDLTLEEVLKQIDVTDQLTLKFAWSLMAFDGLRAGEVLGLFSSDIDLEKKTIRLLRRKEQRYYPKGMKVDQEPKLIPLNDFSAALFKQLIYNPGERIVPISYKTLRKWFGRYVNIANIHKSFPMTTHKLRHFFGHYWDKNKGNIRILQQVMRHSDIEYTLLYTEPSDKEIKEEFAAVMKF